MKHIYLTLFVFFATFFCSQAQALEAYEIYLTAEKFMKSQKYHEASIFFDKAIAKDPTNYAILYERGRCYIKLRNYEKAAYSFKRVVELQEDYTTAYLLLGYLHNAVGRFEEAIVDYNKAYKYEKQIPRRFTIKLIIIYILDKQGRIKEAEQHLADAKTLGMENEHYLYYQAKFKNLHGHYKEARDYLVKAIAKIENLHPDSVAIELGEKLFIQNINTLPPERQSEATSINVPTKTEIRPNPVNNKKSKLVVEKLAKYYYEMYFALYKLHQYEQAELVYEKAAVEPFKKKMAPLHLSYLYNIAYGYYQIHEFNKSRDVIDEIIRQSAEHNGGTTLMFKIIDAENDKSAIIEQIEVAMLTQKDKSLQQMQLETLKLYLNAGKYDKLIQLADNILAQRPDNHEALFYKALAFSKDLDKQTETYALFDKLFHLPYAGKKQESKYRFALGMFAYRMENYKKAGLSYQACNYLYFKSAAHREMKKILPSDMK